MEVKEEETDHIEGELQEGEEHLGVEADHREGELQEGKDHLGVGPGRQVANH